MQSQGNYLYHGDYPDKALNLIPFINYPETRGFAFYKYNNTGFKVYSDIGVYDIKGRTKYRDITCLLAACGVPVVHLDKE